MKRRKIIIGTRASKLALIYAEKAKNRILESSSELSVDNVEIKKITTEGDLNLTDRLSEIGGKGLFSKKIEKELLENKINIAVHALKDMPSDETPGLITSCFLKRSDPREVLITLNNKKFKNLDENSIIGTSSYRREFQLKYKRKDLKYKLIRGNVDTRINKLKQNSYNGIILSYAGIKNLNFEKYASEIFELDELIPSAGQGVIALQSKIDDIEINKILNNINDDMTANAAIAERNVLKVLEGDCETAIGVISAISQNKISIKAELFSLDGSKRFFCSLSDTLSNHSDLGIKVGEILKKDSNGVYKK